MTANVSTDVRPILTGPTIWSTLLYGVRLYVRLSILVLLQWSTMSPFSDGLIIGTMTSSTMLPTGYSHCFNNRWERRYVYTFSDTIRCWTWVSCPDVPKGLRFFIETTITFPLFAIQWMNRAIFTSFGNMRTELGYYLIYSFRDRKKIHWIL